MFWWTVSEVGEPTGKWLWVCLSSLHGGRVFEIFSERQPVPSCSESTEAAPDEAVWILSFLLITVTSVWVSASLLEMPLESRSPQLLSSSAKACQERLADNNRILCSDSSHNSPWKECQSLLLKWTREEWSRGDSYFSWGSHVEFIFWCGGKRKGRGQVWGGQGEEVGGTGRKIIGSQGPKDFPEHLIQRSSNVLFLVVESFYFYLFHKKSHDESQYIKERKEVLWLKHGWGNLHLCTLRALQDTIWKPFIKSQGWF